MSLAKSNANKHFCLVYPLQTLRSYPCSKQPPHTPEDREISREQCMEHTVVRAVPVLDVAFYLNLI